ncbi:unnamed protein product [Lymnaea stagnalis]|uniref:Uncharacterized protein n=1 Tax=Lymnaea stagnalis TaxID=6523 RepID=A0AAV2HZN6_LYMST
MTIQIRGSKTILIKKLFPKWNETQEYSIKYNLPVITCGVMNTYECQMELVGGRKMTRSMYFSIPNYNKTHFESEATRSKENKDSFYIIIISSICLTAIILVIASKLCQTKSVCGGLVRYTKSGDRDVLEWTKNKSET